MRLSGSGGQGLITLGIIIAEAAILDGKLAVQSQSYGPEARGGASKAEVIISDRAIHYPKVLNPELVLAMTQEATNKYTKDLVEDGVLIIDTTYVTEIPANVKKVYRLPITEACTKELGRALFANIVACGVIVAMTKAVSKESALKAVLARVPKGTEEINTKAFELGISLYNSHKN